MKYNQEQIAVTNATKKIELLLLDVDGVLTDGRLYFSNTGEELKTFHSLDGHGIKMLKNANVEVGIITGRISKIVEYRAENLGIDLLFQGREDKLKATMEVILHKSLTLEQVAYVGDDLPDLPAIQQVGIGFSVPNGHEEVQKAAAAITENIGGNGAVREITDFILKSQNKY